MLFGFSRNINMLGLGNKCLSINIYSHCRRLATFRSIIPDVEIPKVSYPQFLLDHVKNAPGTAMVCAKTGKTISYPELISGVKAVSSGLVKSGFNNNDVMCIYSPNCVEYPIAMLGAMAAGGIVTTANPAYTAGEVAYQLKDSGTKFMLTSKENFNTAAEAAKLSKCVQEIYIFDDKIPGTKQFSKLLDDDGSADRVNELSNVKLDDKVSLLLYSSGTTGLPKGVLHTHRTLVAVMCQSLSILDDMKNDVLSGLMPLFHVYANVCILGFNLLSTSTLVVHRQFDPLEFLEAIWKYKCSILHLVPPIVLFLLNHSSLKKSDLSSVKKIVSAAAPLNKETEYMFAKKFPEIELCQGWGLTEATFITYPPSKQYRSANHNNKHGNSGILLPNQELKFLHHKTKKELGVGEQGELVVKGVNIMKGYLNKPEATASCVIDGWFYTGDIGYIDEDGYVFIVDRLKELIKVKGMQVAPAELEAILLTHPSVQDAAVIGKQDDRSGEVPVAFVVLKKDTNETEQSIYNWMASRVAKHKNLDGGIFFTDDIPKAASGKILRRILKEKVITK